MGVRMLVGNAPCSWGVNYATGNAFSWEQYLDQVAEAGYRATELGPLGFLPRDPYRLKDELGRRGLALIGATHVHTFGDAATIPALMAALGELGSLLKALGAKHLVIMDESNWYPSGKEGVLDHAGWAGLCNMVRQAQLLVESEHGLELSFHPHVGTAVQRETEIDRLLAETGVDLCFDTGHHAFWNQDPLAYMQKVWGRIAYVHLKNVDGAVCERVLGGTLSVEASYGQGIMCPLPDGVVDIRSVMGFLEGEFFSGPVVVEQDVSANAEEPPLALAARNLAYLKAIG